MAKTIHIVNGPNLNLIGRREPSVYGDRNLGDFLEQLQTDFADRVQIELFQSNSEGALLDHLQQVGLLSELPAHGIVLNAGAYGHTSLALGDCLRALSVPVVEVHISNVFAREGFRQNSFVSPVVKGSISGLGLEGYRLAVEWLIATTSAR